MSEPLRRNKTTLLAPEPARLILVIRGSIRLISAKQDQQNRIANGVKSGQLTPGETRRLERGEQRLQNNEKKDMAKDNRHLTKRDQRHLNREANHMSKRIYKDKHNTKTN